jgi:two-component system sensor histidine kinase KdpD
LEIRTAVRRLDGLVTNLLNQTRLEAGSVKPRMDWCDPRDLIVAARRAVGERMEGHPLEIDLRPNGTMFFADAVLMEQVIANLLHNAAVHTPRGTAIRISAGATERPPRVFVSVEDEGPGISPELRSRIFSKFQSGPTARPGGLGLGLSIVRGFMLAQGGDVSLTLPVKGARFTVYLPRLPEGNVPNG